MALDQLAVMESQRSSRPRGPAALVDSVIVFIAAWVDGRGRLVTERLEQRKLRVEA
jgi:hypothetical protein